MAVSFKLKENEKVKVVFDLVLQYHFEQLLDLADALSKEGFAVDVVFCDDGVPLLTVRRRKP